MFASRRQTARFLILVFLVTLSLIGCAPTVRLVTPTVPPATLAPLSSPTPTVTASPASSDTPSLTPSVIPSLTPSVTASSTVTPITPAQQTPTSAAADGSVGVVDPHIALSASVTTVAVGEEITLSGVAVDIGLPYYSVMVQDQSAPRPSELARVTYGNESKLFEQASQLLQVVDLSADMKHIQVTLRAVQPGTVQVWVSATGEIHYANGATWAGGGSEPITLTITP